MVVFFFFKQKTAYEMRISDWSSDVCSSDLGEAQGSCRRGYRRCVQADQQIGSFRCAERRSRKGEGSIRQRRSADADGSHQAGQEAGGRKRSLRHSEGWSAHRWAKYEADSHDGGDRKRTRRNTRNKRAERM